MSNFDFSLFDNRFREFICDDLPASDGFDENIRHCLSDIKSSHIALGLALHSLLVSRAYGYRSSDHFYDLSTTQFFYYCYKEFRLDKSQVSRHMNVVYRFCHNEPELLPKFADRSFSFLCELLPYTDEQIDELLIHCVTVTDVRTYAKSHFLSPKNDSNTKKDKNITSVATSQQTATDELDVFLSEPVHIPLSCYSRDYTHFDRFRGLTLQQILLNYIALERKYTELSQSLSITNS